MVFCFVFLENGLDGGRPSIWAIARNTAKQAWKALVEGSSRNTLLVGHMGPRELSATEVVVEGHIQGPDRLPQ